MTSDLDLVNICEMYETYKSGEDETTTRESGIICRCNDKFLGNKAHYEHNRCYRCHDLKERVGKSKPRLRRGQWNTIAFKRPSYYRVGAFVLVRPRSRPIASPSVSFYRWCAGLGPIPLDATCFNQRRSTQSASLGHSVSSCMRIDTKSSPLETRSRVKSFISENRPGGRGMETLEGEG